MSTDTRTARPASPEGTSSPHSATSQNATPSIAAPANEDQLLQNSRQFCERLTREQARNFYYGLRLLPPLQRRSMFALYAYMRLVDDIADEEDGRTAAQREEDLAHWRAETHAILSGQKPSTGDHGSLNSSSNGSSNGASDGASDGASRRGSEIWPAFFEMAAIHRIPPRIFDDVIEGQRQDLQPVTFATFEQLYEYCYQVAGTVGLASIYIWGFEGGEETELLAVERGLAFQLTNILRDLREDAARGRTYLPADELAAAGVTTEQLARGEGGEGFERMMQEQIRRAESYYEKSAALDQRIDRESRPTLVVMTEIYRRLLKKIKADPKRVLRQRVSLSLLSKLRIGWRATRSK